LPDRRVLRIVTAVLLMWIAVDLAAVHTCVLQGGHGQAPARSSVSAPPCTDGPVHSHAVLHPDHCFCHSLSTGADLTAALVDPQSVGRSLPDNPAGHVLGLSAVLDHPPQLPG
jgi:hypothetical protein